MMGLAIGGAALASWAYLLAARGGFWQGRETDADEPPPPAVWPSVVVVVPARDEADVIGRSIESLLAQDYPGPFRVILVDDDSSDGTAEAALAAAGLSGARGRLGVIRAGPLPAGWTGKLWAMSQGVARAEEAGAEFLLFTDADIAHASDNVRRLVARAEASGLALTSLMARLHCETAAERLMIPAFILFFQMLYPFRWANDPGRKLAAAAGGCMLVRRRALAAAGGVAAVRAAIIDDCALARVLKRQGPIWIGLTRRARSLRPYRTLGAVGRMISRSAFAQLDYSALVLAGTLLGLGLTFAAPPVLALFGSGAARLTGALSWAAMTLAFQPTLRLYGRSPLWGVALPAIAAIYGGFTFKSALDVWSGRGGMWKGRAQAIARPA
jgi:hopene-associated glycosyltransferase HpnB